MGQHACRFLPLQAFAWGALKNWTNGFSAASYATAAGEVDVIEHATGTER